MSRCLTRRVAVLFVLAVLLAAPWSIAAPREERGAASPMFLAQLWNQWTTLWSEIGCGLDPNGGCGQIDIGCVADPSGLCRDTAESHVDIGCGADPNGVCGPGPSQADIGCVADPNGGCGQ